ncbi:MAG: hypothetical protein AABY55_05150 [Candidatus Omnitrophota bacterium]
MKSNIKKDRQLLIAFLLLLFLTSSVFLVMGLDETSRQYAGKSFFRVFFSIVVLLLLLVAVYLYKICRLYYSSVVSWIIVIVFIACFFSQFSLITFLIGMFIIWKSKRLPDDE